MDNHRPVLLYDKDCNFCRHWIARWRGVTGNRVKYTPFQDVKFPPIPAEAFETAVQLIEPGGEVFSGAEAVFRVLAYAPRRGGPLWLYQKLFGFARISEWVYRFVAEHRTAFSRVTQWFCGQWTDN